MVASYRDKPSAYEFEEMLAQLGGAQALRDDPNDFRKAVERLWDERDSLNAVEQFNYFCGAYAAASRLPFAVGSSKSMDKTTCRPRRFAFSIRFN